MRELMNIVRFCHDRNSCFILSGSAVFIINTNYEGVMKMKQKKKYGKGLLSCLLALDFI